MGITLEKQTDIFFLKNKQINFSEQQNIRKSLIVSLIMKKSLQEFKKVKYYKLIYVIQLNKNLLGIMP